jgi:hypothetical protein
MLILHILRIFTSLTIIGDLHKGKSRRLLAFRRNLLPQRQHVSTKLWKISLRTHGVTSQIIIPFIVTVVRASNLIYVLPFKRVQKKTIPRYLNKDLTQYLINSDESICFMEPNLWECNRSDRQLYSCNGIQNPLTEMRILWWNWSS